MGNYQKKRLGVNRHNESPFAKFDQIDGSHDYQSRVPDGFVSYQVRTLPGGRVLYFNFGLAKEMGLIPEGLPHKLTAALERAILKTFAIRIINENDIEEGRKFPSHHIRPNRYMATRYLQLQHPNKNGTTSGDGRSIWNGQVTHRGTTWDISSCGTGATRLSPATAIENKFFRTGDPNASYGDGTSTPAEGLSAAVMSEIFHYQGVLTERTLALIEFPGGTSINVRAGKNLIRPSHFFGHLKQEEFERLKGSVDHFIDRQIDNGDWPKLNQRNRYRFFADEMARIFGQMTARFESDYIFVWLDWDGDNILGNGGIIDYGSVRQFGLFHHKYRFDDDGRWSTSIPEQKHKARDLVVTFCQIADYLESGTKKSRDKFLGDPAVRLFDQTFQKTLSSRVLYFCGFKDEQISYLQLNHPVAVENFQKIYSYFERQQSSRGHYRVSDGITHDAIYCMRDLLRELPAHLLSFGEWPTESRFLEMMASTYATKSDRKLTPTKKLKIREFLKAYLRLIELSDESPKKPRDLILEIVMRASVRNPVYRMTGNGMILATDRILSIRKNQTRDEFQETLENFIHQQGSHPFDLISPSKGKSGQKGKIKKFLSQLLKVVKSHRDGI